MPDNDFKDAKVIPGLEHLGRGIVDAQGQPSGSPANYEATRGKGEEPLSATAYKDVMDALKKEFPPEKK